MDTGYEVLMSLNDFLQNKLGSWQFVWPHELVFLQIVWEVSKGTYVIYSIYFFTINPRVVRQFVSIGNICKENFMLLF